MPTLSQALNTQNQQQDTTIGVGGQLSTQKKPAPGETTPIQSLAGQAGLQAPPITPMGAAALGANPDQQKMMGTPAQTQSALTLALQPPDQGLSGALRQQQSRTQMTGQEQASAQKSTDMKNLGNLGDRVTSFIDTQRQLLEEQKAPVAVAAASQFNTAKGTQDIGSMAPLLAQLRNDPSNMDLQLQVQKGLGRDINSTLTPDQVNQLYQSATDAIATGTASNVADKLSVTDLVNSGKLGYDLPTLSNLLGVPQDQVSQMSVGQLRSQIDAVGTQEFSNAQQNQQKAQSGELGQAERGLAQQAARETSSTGVRASEADYGSLEKQISSADQVSFGGKQYQVDDLLKDSTISGIVADYLNAPDGSSQKAQLEKTEPGLVDFIHRNQAVLADASANLGKGATGFSDIQSANKTIGKMNNQSVSDDVLKDVVPGFGQLQSSKVDPNSVPMIAAIKNSDNPDGAAASVNAANSVVPGIGKQINSLDPSLLGPLMGNNGQRLATYTQNVQDYKNVRNIASSGDPEQISKLAMGASYSQVKQGATEAYTRDLLGLPSNGLGNLGSAAGSDAQMAGWMVNNILNRQGNPSLAAAAQGADQSFKKQQYQNNPPLGPSETDALSKLSSVVKGPQSIDLNKALGAGLNMSQVSMLLNKGASALTPEVRESFYRKQASNLNDKFGDIYSLARTWANPHKTVSQIGGQSRVNDQNVVKDKIDASTRDIQELLKDPVQRDTYGEQALRSRIDQLNSFKSKIDGSVWLDSTHEKGGKFENEGFSEFGGYND